MATQAKTNTQTRTATKTKRFRVVLEQHRGSAAIVVTLPFDSVKFFGARGQVPVRATIKGHSFRTTIFPTGDGTHYMVINRHARAASGVRAGEMGMIELARDEEPRVITPPADFARALRANKAARAAWNKLSYTHCKEYAQAIEEAKRPETRARRIAKAIEALSAGKKQKYD
jgi:hypothetical protein